MILCIGALAGARRNRAQRCSRECPRVRGFGLVFLVRYISDDLEPTKTIILYTLCVIYSIIYIYIFTRCVYIYIRRVNYIINKLEFIMSGKTFGSYIFSSRVLCLNRCLLPVVPISCVYTEYRLNNTFYDGSVMQSAWK